MIYLTLDTDVWLNTLVESGKEYNTIDALVYWIESGHITILLPECISNEWNRNRDKKRRTLEEDWRHFFNRSKKVFPSSLINNMLTPEHINSIVEKQLGKVNTIFESLAIKIPIKDQHRIDATGLAEQKKAPFGNKNSMGDALIYLAMTDYIASNALNNCVFVTNNKSDFSHKDYSDRIHPDLEPRFTELNIAYYIDIRRFMHDYSDQLPNVSEIIKLEAIKEEGLKLANATLNPLTMENLTGLRESYIDNINHIDLILKAKNPTREQVVFALNLIKSDANYAQYLFNKVESTIWFSVFKSQDVFNPKNNPSPIKEDSGFKIPYWEPLTFLEKLSIQIKNGEALELINELLSVINDVSHDPKDNNRTWHVFIKILVNLPSDRISKETLDLIPVWLKSNFDTRLQTSEICKKLLPKFLSENPDKEDSLKAEMIIKHLLAVEKLHGKETNSAYARNKTYGSNVYMYFLREALTEKHTISKIAKYCSDELIVYLANNIKKLYHDFPDGINAKFSADNYEYSIKAKIESSSVVLELISENLLKSQITSSVFSEYEKFDKNNTRQSLINGLKELGIDYKATEENEHNLKIIINALFNGSYLSIINPPISKLSDREEITEGIEDVFAVIFRDLLNQKTKQNTIDSQQLLKKFALDTAYRLPIFRRIAIYIIGENWLQTKSVFWEMVRANDVFFNSHIYQKDIYELLNKNQLKLTEKEASQLEEIIASGPQDEKKNPDHDDYWRLSWYAALRNHRFFEAKYSRLSESLRLTHNDIESDGVITTWVGSESPLSVQEILQKSQKEIVQYIHAFKPIDQWRQPDVSGLSAAIGEAVEEQPNYFSEELDLYHDVYYIYAYHMLNGFRKAWQSKKPFDWDNVLRFCNNYIQSSKFYSGQLALDVDGWGATPNWVVGAIGNLLSEGMRSDSNAFDLSLLPGAKEIITTLIIHLEAIEDIDQTNMDYPTYSLNSTAGKVLMALLDYSLRRARNLEDDTTFSKWEEDIINLVETTIDKEIIDTYILTGMYFQQFYFLKKDWILQKVEQFLFNDDREWLAFMGGFLFSKPAFKKDIYAIFRPHYERIIKTQLEKDHFQSRSIITHVAAYHFWGFEDSKNNDLLYILIDHANPSVNLELVNYLCQNERQLKHFSSGTGNMLEKIIFDLWVYLTAKYEHPQSQDEQKTLASFISFLSFVPILNRDYTTLVLKSSKLADQHFQFHYLAENLIKLMPKGDPIHTAQSIGMILNSIDFREYFQSTDDQQIIDLVTFLYENGQKDAADMFSNRLSKQGHGFLIELYRKYNA